MKAPILIPAKKFSLRCPGKNLKLLRWTIDWLGSEKDRAILLTDSEELIKQGSDIKSYFTLNTDGELIVFQEWLKQNPGITEYIYLPLTQPLRELDLLSRLDNMVMGDDIDFITSYTITQDRTIFEITEEGKFKYPSPAGRKGSLCSEKKVLDGAIYYIKSDFTLSLSTNDINRAFWNGRIGLIENNMPLLDIDTPQDLSCFNNLKALYNVE